MAVNNKDRTKINIDDIQEDTPIKEEPVEEVVEEVQAEVAEEVTEEVPVEEVVEEVVEEPVKEAEAVDYKKRYADSSREAMALNFQKEKLSTLLSEDLEVPEPTEEDLKMYAVANGAEYEELDTFSRNILKRTLLSERREQRRVQAYAEMHKVEAWGKKVDEFAASEENMSKYPSLEGQEDDFKKYCMKETQRGVDFNILVASFLYENDKIPAKKSKGSMFLSRGNGRAGVSKPAGITESEAASIRIRDPKEYRRLIKSGKINIEL